MGQNTSKVKQTKNIRTPFFIRTSYSEKQYLANFQYVVFTSLAFKKQCEKQPAAAVQDKNE
jgi:hypothetical protein